MCSVRNKASKLASDVLTNFWDDVFPVDPVAISRRFGIDVYYDDLPEEVSGALIKTAEMGFPIIMVETSEPGVRKRFTVAHELGHYLYNTFILKLEDTYEKFDFRGLLSSQGNNEEEIFANSFAAALLMPEKEIRKKGKSLNQTQMLELASQFNVSLEALTYRLQNLNIQYNLTSGNE
ncbi:ImmA/IrrE family metallo-endopeptidase [Psittacicella hinzii]|uniref:IrrE N-terminal-like domain-containing protein n=1 Tax=Psittacicella hinzii TaxID=2028575 RepID=A0A3A1YPK3_9GAMM|nr:ImmA/IrrE family metallo-endopeptidase [Psittacicella hinzii]RIY39471.1 hypothetical protein CKF58_02080 [Psittacicella hinzii]